MDTLLVIFLVILTLTIFGFLFVAKTYFNSLLIIKQQKLILMELQQIKDDLQVANQTIQQAAETAVKIDKDVESLHAKIDALPENPDAAAIQEIKELAAVLRTNTSSLKDALVATDEKTEDVVETPETPENTEEVSENTEV